MALFYPNPLPIANGGTGDTGSAWTAYSPTATMGQATGTAVGTATGRYKTVGKTVYFTMTNTVSGTFTAGTFANFSLPSVPVTSSGGVWAFSGAETGATGIAWTGWCVSNNVTAFCRTATGSSTVLAGYIITISGTYEQA